MSDIKKQLIKLGADQPELQKHIKPVLDAVAKEAGMLGKLHASGSWSENREVVGHLLMSLESGDMREATRMLGSMEETYRELKDWIRNASEEDMSDFIAHLQKKR